MNSTYVEPSSTLDLIGIDVGTVTVAGFTGVCRALELSVEHDRETHDRFGNATAAQIGTGGFRKVTGKLTFYRADLSADTLFDKSDANVAISFSIGTGVNGYQFSIPAAVISTPADETDGSKTLITLEFTAEFDTTAATDVSVTKLV